MRLADSVDTTADSLRRRRAAAWRLPPLACGRRDPLDPLDDEGPGWYGLTGAELYAEAHRLTRSGWRSWEVRRRLADPRRMS